jgi:hypothetical protein
LFAEILRLIAELRLPPGNIDRVGCLHVTRFEPNPREDCVQMNDWQTMYPGEKLAWLLDRAV